MSALPRALLADDNDELRAATADFLEEMGYAVTAASRGDEALEAFAAASPDDGFDLLVSDISMPGKNGIELADGVLARDRSLAVLLISSRGGDFAVKRRLAVGDVAFLAKPFALDELAVAIAEARDRAAQRRPAAVSPPPPVELRRKSWTRAAVQPVWQLAAAVVLVLGLGAALGSLELGAPSLPAPGPDLVRRSLAVEALSPVGVLDQAPSELRWRPVEGAGSYHVSLRRVDQVVFWQGTVDGPRAELPADVASGLHRAVTYYWTAEARDAEGRPLAGSGPVSFRIDLRP